MKKNIFYLTGFMGSGKSTIGPILANTLGWEFYDLDKLIEDKVGKPVRKIFEVHGENYFRNLETEMLLELSEKEELIVSLGGGTIASDRNIAILKKSGIIIYLKMSPESAVKRLKFKRDRPVLFSDLKENFSNNDLLNKITELYEKRKVYYEQSDVIINTDDITIGQTINKIVRIVHQENKRDYEKD
jgi:shikimate kinase